MESPKTSSKLPVFVGIGILIVLVGLGMGWYISSKRVSANRMQVKSSAVVVTQSEAGLTDTTGFKDTAIGTLQVGGIRGEGTYHLVRPGGDSQNVYLTSTVADMSPFVGKKVQVWGQTQASQNAGWFMDVGKIKVVN